MKQRKGLILLVCLIMLSGALAMAWALAQWSLLAMRESMHAQQAAALRAGAEAAARLGLAQLQQWAGPDTVHTFENGNAGLQVMSATATGVESLGGEVSDQGLRLSWRIQDASQAFDEGARYRAKERASAWAKTSTGRQKLPFGWPAEELSAEAKRALKLGSREWFEAHLGPALPAGTSWQSRGLLTNPVRGGWKGDLAVAENLSKVIGVPLAQHLSSAAMSVEPRQGYPQAEVIDGERSFQHRPVLADFRLSLGFFNSRNDGRHRLRFHTSAVLWNPADAPILAGPQGRLFLVEVDGAPEVTITNLDSQASIVVNLDDCPQADFGAVRQGLRERGLWCWVGVDDPYTWGMSARGLLPGEVYALVSPSPETQPQGLARILSKTTWKLDRQPHGPTWKRPSPNVFTPKDRIEIAVRFLEKVALRLRPAGVEPDRDTALADYPLAPVMELRNISFPDFLIRTTGEDYSREDSSGYVIAERRACMRFKLRPRALAEWLEGDRLRTHWDWAEPASAAEWTVDNPLLAALDVCDFDVMPLMGPLWDAVVNRHAADQVGAFASLRLRDLPAAPMLSVGALRWLEVPAGLRWAATLDAACALAPPLVAQPGVCSDQPWLVPWADVGLPAAATSGPPSLAIDGIFNVNSRRREAWETLLLGGAGAWSAEAGGAFPAGSLSGPKVFLHPHGAGLAKGGTLSPVDGSDSAIAGLTEVEREGLEAQQSVRQLEPAKVRRWAEKLVELQLSSGWPFASLEAFARSGLLDQAIAAAELNRVGGTDLVAPSLRITGADLLEAWAPILSVRGDTFTVTGRAESLGHSALIEYEFVVQRLPEVHPVAALGRRFRIISVRIRNH